MTVAAVSDRKIASGDRIQGIGSPNFMAQDVNEILAGAKKTLAEAESKFPSSQAPATPAPTPSHYSVVREARKTPTMADEMKAKGEMVQKAKKALEQ